MMQTANDTKKRIGTAVLSRRQGRIALLGLLGALALAIGFATARAQDGVTAPEGTVTAPAQWQGYDKQPLRIDLWQDKQDGDVYQRGESVRIHFEANQDAYAVVYRIDTEGMVTILWPRSRYDDGFVFGEHTYNLPTAGTPRINASDSEGVEYVESIVSAYPFDLRGLEVDFHQDTDHKDQYDYYVAGDPFLAINDVNYAITGLENPEDYVATNYISWYVHRRVDHPRYLCSQCHTEDQGYRPYDDHCTIAIHYDYGWDNDWYIRYGYYPVYYYPAYYYVDPWTWSPWINYWYRPWYAWPVYSGWDWNYHCHVWNYSPYSRGDVWVRYKGGSRRFRPISKGLRYKDDARNVAYHNPDGLVRSPRPTSKEREAMSTRLAMASRGDARTRFRDVGPRTRPASTIRPEPRQTGTPGIRIPDRGGAVIGVRSPSVTHPADGRGTDQVQVRPQSPRDGRVLSGVSPPRNDGGSSDDSRLVRPIPGRDTGSDSRPAVRPVEPRSKGSRLWTGSRNDERSTPTRINSGVRKGSDTRSGSRSTPTVRPSSGGKSDRGSSGSSGTRVKPSRPARDSSGAKPHSSGGSKSRSGSSSGSKSRSSSHSSGSHSSGSQRSRGR